MSISIAIGSDLQDIHNISDTINILNFTKQFISNSSLNIDESNTTYDAEKIDSLIDWYSGIYTILTDVAVFAYTETT